jgi:hypothetical protein
MPLDIFPPGDHPRDCQGGGHSKHGKKCSICRSGLQVLLSAQREGFMRSASQRAAMIEGVLLHILGHAVEGKGGELWHKRQFT